MTGFKYCLEENEVTNYNLIWTAVMRGGFFNQFIELAIQIDSLIRSRRPNTRCTYRAPVPAAIDETEPMQVNSYHPSPEERNRQLSQHLCFYCGQSGHLRISCPSRPHSESQALVSFPVDAFNPDLCVTAPITINVNGSQITTNDLLDSWMAEALCLKNLLIIIISL